MNRICSQTDIGVKGKVDYIQYVNLFKLLYMTVFKG